MECPVLVVSATVSSPSLGDGDPYRLLERTPYPGDEDLPFGRDVADALLLSPPHAASDSSLVGNPPSRSDSYHLGKDFPLTSLEETTSLTPIKIAPIVDDRGRKETISARNLPDVEAVYRAYAARFNSFTGAAFDDFRDSRHPLPHQARPPRSFTK
jgi:hypothetical protein